MRWGPDNRIWVIERLSGELSHVDPATGTKTAIFKIPDLLITPNAQDGLLGLALDPNFGKGSDHVYLAFSIKADGRSPQKTGQEIIRRYTYDASKNTLTSPTDLITGLPHSNDHQAGRVLFGRDGKLYYSIGDQGANQLANWCRPSHAQDLPTAEQVAAKDWRNLEGKIVRLNPDGTIPADNPELGGVRSYVYAYGFRNPQGLDFSSSGTLYEAEHGPKTDDEINRIVAGGNYGWPYVAGYRDDKSYVFADWANPKGVECKSVTFSNYEIPPEIPVQKETEWKGEMIDPLRTFSTVPEGHNFKDPVCAKDEKWNTCWPSRALTALTVYESDGIPGWKNSLLVASLKEGAIFRIGLNADGTAAAGESETYLNTINRYRDILVSSDGKTLYISTDAAGPTTGPTGAQTDQLENPGAILVFTLKP